MKKALAILLLILGGAVTITLVDLATAVFFIMMGLIIPAEGGWALYTMAVMFLFLVNYPFKFLREYCKKKYKINAVVFIICFCAPSLIAAEAANLLYEPPAVDTSKYISSDVVLIFWLIITAVFTFWMIVQSCVIAYKVHRDKNA